MQAILKSKHQRFYAWFHGIKDKLALIDSELDEMEEELFESYNLYLQKREELRTIIQRYEEKQNAIRTRIKQHRALSSLNGSRAPLSQAEEQPQPVV